MPGAPTSRRSPCRRSRLRLPNQRHRGDRGTDVVAPIAVDSTPATLETADFTALLAPPPTRIADAIRMPEGRVPTVDIVEFHDLDALADDFAAAGLTADLPDPPAPVSAQRPRACRPRACRLEPVVVEAVEPVVEAGPRAGPRGGLRACRRGDSGASGPGGPRARARCSRGRSRSCRGDPRGNASCRSAGRRNAHVEIPVVDRPSSRQPPSKLLPWRRSRKRRSSKPRRSWRSEAAPIVEEAPARPRPLRCQRSRGPGSKKRRCLSRTSFRGPSAAPRPRSSPSPATPAIETPAAPVTAVQETPRRGRRDLRPGRHRKLEPGGHGPNGRGTRHRFGSGARPGAGPGSSHRAGPARNRGTRGRGRSRRLGSGQCRRMAGRGRSGAEAPSAPEPVQAAALTRAGAGDDPGGGGGARPRCAVARPRGAGDPRHGRTSRRARRDGNARRAAAAPARRGHGGPSRKKSRQDRSSQARPPRRDAKAARKERRKEERPAQDEWGCSTRRSAGPRPCSTTTSGRTTTTTARRGPAPPLTDG